MNTDKRNNFAAAVIVISLLPGIALLRFEQLELSLDILLFIARIGGVFGIGLMVWEVILASRTISKRLTPDYMFLLKIHKYVGKYGAFLILVHPLLYVFYYLIKYQVNLLNINFSSKFSVAIFIGMIATLMLLIIWVTSVSLRKKLKFRSWHLIHTLTYILVPTAILHTWMISSSDLARAFWGIYTIIYFSMLAYQIAFRFGHFRTKYTVESTETVADNTFTIVMKPVTNKYIKPEPGQFVYLKHQIIPEIHPYSVSNFDPNTGNISVTVKDLGPFSHVLETIQVGDPISLDGAYGVFSQEAFLDNHPAVLLAGGIGITPFMPLIRKIESGWNKPVFLFYGNRAQKDIAFLDYLNKLSTENPNFAVIHVLEKADDANIPHELGFISEEVIAKHLPDKIQNYDFYVVGPPPMMGAMQKMFDKVGVPKHRRHFEKFN